jgi:hypothetical protein
MSVTDGIKSGGNGSWITGFGTHAGPLSTRKALTMKTVWFATAALALGTAIHALPAAADGPRASSGNMVANETATRVAAPHYEWQYHYVGHHARMEGYWALVK